MAIEAMDGRKRGEILRNQKGQFCTRTDYKKGVQEQIDKYYADINRRKQFMDQNPDLKVLNDADQAKINDLKKEMRLVDYSKRGINDRVKIFKESLEKQGVKGTDLENQVAKYREGLLAERRKHFDKLKGKQYTRNIANGKIKVKPKDIKPVKSKGIMSKIGKFFKGKGGKLALIGGALALGALLLNKCTGDNKPAVPTTDAEQQPIAPTEPETPTTPEEPTVPVAPAEPEQPAESADDTLAGVTGNIVQNGDSLEKIAKRYGVTVDELKELNPDKIKQFKTPDGRVIEGFKVGEDIKLPEDTQKADGLKQEDEAISDYEKNLIENFDNIPQSMWNQVSTPEFRRKHKLGEYKEAA